MVDRRALAGGPALTGRAHRGIFQILIEYKYVNKMDILKLAGSLTKSEFSRALEEIKLINHLGLIHDYCQTFDLMVEEGTDIESALHYVYYDMFIEETTGQYKKEFKGKIEDYRKENSL